MWEEKPRVNLELCSDSFWSALSMFVVSITGH